MAFPHPKPASDELAIRWQGMQSWTGKAHQRPGSKSVCSDLLDPVGKATLGHAAEVFSRAHAIRRTGAVVSRLLMVEGLVRMGEGHRGRNSWMCRCGGNIKE